MRLLQGVIRTGHGNELFYDEWSGRLFYSSEKGIKKIINRMNDDIRESILHSAEKYIIDLNDVYYALDIPTILLGSEKIFKGYIGLRIGYDHSILQPYFNVKTIKFIDEPLR